ncbi:MAG: FHA domain-containing protein [Anaerolineales bacterium]
MAASFGRLEIYWPEGPTESFVLTKSVFALGRSTGNDLVIDRHGVSRYHAKLSIIDGQAVLEDLESVNGTYVDSLRLPGSEPRTLRGGEEIQIADVRMIYQPPEPAGETLGTELDDTAIFQTNEGLSVHINNPEIIIIPGAHAQSVVLITNTSDAMRDYTVSVEGVPKEWVRLERTTVQLNPNEQTKVFASFKPLRRSETKPGTYPVTYTVSPEDDPEAGVVVHGEIVLGSYSGYGVMMGTPRVENNEAFRLFVHNQGNDALTVAFKGVDPQNKLNFAIDPPRLTLAAGERRSVYGKIRPRGGSLVGSTREYRYDIVTVAEDQSRFQAAVTGTYVAQPMLPSWAATVAIPLVAILAIALVALGVMALGDDDPDPSPAPEISAFVVAPSGADAYTEGQPVTVNWQAQHTDTVYLRYRRAEAAPIMLTDGLPAEVGTGTIILPTSGNLMIEIATAPDAEASQMQAVAVEPPSLAFEVSPQAPLQNVAQTLQIDWATPPEMANYTLRLTITRGDDTQEYMPGPNDAPYVVESFMPMEAPVFVELTVIGNDNLESSQPQTLEPQPARCTTNTTDSVRFYQGPGESYVQTAEVNASAIDQEQVIVQYRDPSANWLHVIYDDNVQGWVNQAIFSCAGFAVADLRAAPANLIPPTVTPQPPTPTPIPQTATPQPPTPTPPPAATATPLDIRQDEPAIQPTSAVRSGGGPTNPAPGTAPRNP